MGAGGLFCTLLAEYAREKATVKSKAAEAL